MLEISILEKLYSQTRVWYKSRGPQLYSIGGVVVKIGKLSGLATGMVVGVKAVRAVKRHLDNRRVKKATRWADPSVQYASYQRRRKWRRKKK